jgi:hypothetical protein
LKNKSEEIVFENAEMLALRNMNCKGPNAKYLSIEAKNPSIINFENYINSNLESLFFELTYRKNGIKKEKMPDFEKLKNAENLKRICYCEGGFY